MGLAVVFFVFAGTFLYLFSSMNSSFVIFITTVSVDVLNTVGLYVVRVSKPPILLTYRLQYWVRRDYMGCDGASFR